MGLLGVEEGTLPVCHWGLQMCPCLPPRMMSTLKELEARSSETRAVAFQHLLLLVGLHLFKVLWSVEKGAWGLEF